jgi:hypothetical protein
MTDLESRVENIVRLISSDKYVVPKGEKKSEIEKMEQFVSYKKPLEDTMTDMVTNKFLEKDSTVGSYIQIIISTFTYAIDKYKVFKNIHHDDIHFVYKGGNILRVLAKELMHELPGITSMVLDDYYSKFFQKSDADFSIYINPILPTFDEIFEDMTNMSYLVLSMLRCVFISDIAKYFDFFTSSQDIQKSILKQKLDELNSSDVFRTIKESKYYGGKIVKLIFADIAVNADDTDTSTSTKTNGIIGSNREDFIMDFNPSVKPNVVNVVESQNISSIDNLQSVNNLQPVDKLPAKLNIDVVSTNVLDNLSPLMTEVNDISHQSNKNNNGFKIMSMSGGNNTRTIDPTILDIFNIIPLHKMQQSTNNLLNTLIDYETSVYKNLANSPYFVSVNKTLRFTLKDKLMGFNLVRLKANTKAIVEYPSKEQTIINLAGEMIDVSILHKSSTGIHEFFSKLNTNIKTYEYKGKHNNSFKFKATSKEYLVHDLELILFGTVEYPWVDNKYSKRIKRLLYLYLIDMLSMDKPGSITDVKDYLFNFQNDCLLPLLYTNLSQDNYKEKVEPVLGSINKYYDISKKNNYYITTFLEKYKEILSKSINEISELISFIKVIKESFDAIEQAFAKIINYITYNKGKIGAEQIYVFEQWGGLSPTERAGGLSPKEKNYTAKYAKYKAKYMKLKYNK